MKRQPVPHLFMEGGGLVTRCQDVEQARLLLRELATEGEDPCDCDVPGCDECIYQDGLFPAKEAHVGHGRIVPAQPNDPDGYTWWWRSGDGQPGQRGVTLAVWWD
jgi:hypothetical protein